MTQREARQGVRVERTHWFSCATCNMSGTSNAGWIGCRHVTRPWSVRYPRLHGIVSYLTVLFR